MAMLYKNNNRSCCSGAVSSGYKSDFGGENLNLKEELIIFEEKNNKLKLLKEESEITENQNQKNKVAVTKIIQNQKNQNGSRSSSAKNSPKSSPRNKDGKVLHMAEAA